MNRFGILAVITVSLLTLGIAPPAGNVVGQETAQQTSDVERVTAANQVFIAAISARDIRVMEKVWVHESYATFIGPQHNGCGWLGWRQKSLGDALQPV
jgi:hypothetical protein